MAKTSHNELMYQRVDTGCKKVSLLFIKRDCKVGVMKERLNLPQKKHPTA
jgi:hypothetical protein